MIVERDKNNGTFRSRIQKEIKNIPKVNKIIEMA